MISTHRPRAPGEHSFRPRALFALLLLSLALAWPGLAAEFSGSVQLKTSPLRPSVPLEAGAVVRIEALKGPPRVFQAQTDGAGHFRLEAVPPGGYRLQVIHPDHPVFTQQVHIGQSALHLELVLDQTMPATPVVEVTDRAIARETPAAFSNLSRQDLTERGAIKDLPVLLAELPSTTTYSENGNGVGYNYLSIRGFDQRRISVMIDGVPQNDPEDHNVYWINLFDLGGALEDVQVQRGAGAGFYGPPSIGGSINLLTRQLSAEAHSQVELGYGSYGTQRYTGELNTGLLAQHWVLFARFSHLRSEGYRDWSWSRYSRGFLGLGYYNEGTAIKLQVFGGPQWDALAYYGISKADNEDDALRRCNWGAPESLGDSLVGSCSNPASGDIEQFAQYHAYLTWDQRLSERAALRNTLFLISGKGYFDFTGYWGDPYYFRFDEQAFPQYFLDEADPHYAAIPGDTLIRAFVDNLQVGWLPRMSYRHLENGGDKGEVTLGVELRTHHSVHWGRLQEGTFPADLTQAYVGEGADRHYYQYEGAKDMVAPYVNERLTLGRASLDANLQLVAQRYRFFGELYADNRFEVPYLFANPRVGLNFNLTPSFNLYGALGYTQREPRLKELYDAENASYGATPDLSAVVPEALLDVELGLHFQQEGLRITANVFDMKFRNEIVKTGGLDQYGQPYYGNASSTRHVGAELELAMEPLKGLELAGNATFSRNRFVRFDEYVAGGGVIARDGNPLTGSPDLTGHARLSYGRSGARLAVDARFVGKQYTDNSADTYEDGTPANGARVVDAYYLLGAQLAYDFPDRSPLRGLGLSLEAQNLLDEKVLLAGIGDDNFFPAAPRSFFGRMRYTWRARR